MRWKGQAEYTERAAKLWKEGGLTLPSLDLDGSLRALVPDRPSREDDRVRTVDPRDMRRLRKGGTLESRRGIVHALCHIESWAVDLSWDIIARFGADPAYALPRDFFDDFVQVAEEECKHHRLLESRLQELGSHYGAYPVHDALWHSAEATAHSLPARLAVEHCVHEARGLDVMPQTVQNFRKHGDEVTADLLWNIIYQEEITHCAAGVRWLTWLHNKALREGTQEDLDPGVDDWRQHARHHDGVELWFHDLTRTYFKGSLKPPFNDKARAAAGFHEGWYLPLQDRSPNVRKSSNRVNEALAGSRGS
eukprot:jgi/Botrbrau1/10470/Bobra.0133s0076.1